ncbi:hypothetical protein EJB05_10503 [Eragrostis curvula]|uniref:NAC domain-containing protein n=1 Tax=Eragrostis curvula TaxID=38414 RepID=A0A5J9VQ44_9POAL|nr:hypothetical protein EJB05_10503 [Eragrostis curvula]
MEMMMMSCPAATHEATQLPPGFRFHPTDEELILHYLRNRAASLPCPVPIIADVDIYKFDPWDLPCKAVYGDGEWYFFSPRDRKYPNGIRPNRAAGSGYWKATGTDKPIHDGATGESVGVKKALVFYQGRPPKGTKTNWIMHEYRLAGTDPLAVAAGAQYRPPPVKYRNVSMRLDDWVLCRIYKKFSQASPMVPPLADYDRLDNDEHSAGGSGGGGFDDICSFAYAPTTSAASTTTHQQQQQLPSVTSFSDLFDDYSLSQIFDTAAPADADHAPFAMHPSLNQLLAIGGDTTTSAHSASELIYSSYPVAGTAKRKTNLEDGAVDGQPPAKRFNVSCFAAQQPASGLLSATSQALQGGLNHDTLPQF